MALREKVVDMQEKGPKSGWDTGVFLDLFGPPQLSFEFQLIGYGLDFGLKIHPGYLPGSPTLSLASLPPLPSPPTRLI